MILCKCTSGTLVMAAEEDFADDELNDESEIQLGFAEIGTNKLFLDKNWANWDGGKIGGKPVWLNYELIPTAQDLQCKICSDPMLLLTQIYCPLDSPTTAFHRSLYVFCCRNAKCIDQGRCQLPKVNSYYPPEANSDSGPDLASPDMSPRASVCVICGCRAASCCSRCLKASYCSRAHQKCDWKRHKTTCQYAASSTTSVHIESVNEDFPEDSILFAEFEVVIEDEVLGERAAVGGTSGGREPEIWEGAVTEGGEGEEEDAALRQADYNAALGNKEDHTDPVYVNFLTRVSLGGADQVLRYCCANKRGESEDTDGVGVGEHIEPFLPLPVSSKGQVKANEVPCCERCGAQRSFEFQIMPQLLHYLNVDKGTALVRLQPLKQNVESGETSSSAVPSLDSSGGKVETEGLCNDSIPVMKAFVNDKHLDIDWGSLDIFTCSKSCDTSAGSGNFSAYVSEFVWKQPSPMNK